MKSFNYIITNPPYQDNINKKKTQHKIWIEFVEKFVNNLENDGKLIFITPTSWSSTKNKVLKIFKEKNIEKIDLTIGKYFDKASTFSYWVLSNSKNKDKTKFIIDDGSYEFMIDDSIMYIPNDISEHSLNIHKKVMFDKRKKFDVIWDSSTCHNIRRRTKGKTLSEIKTKKHVYPVVHTNRKIWFSSIKQKFYENRKVVWSRSGYFEPKYYSDPIGTTDLCYFILVKNDKQGINLESLLNSLLYRYICKTARWSGFGDHEVYINIPFLDFNKNWCDDDIFDFFELSEDEIQYVRNFNV